MTTSHDLDMWQLPCDHGESLALTEAFAPDLGMTAAALLQSVSDIDSGAYCARPLFDCAAISIVSADAGQMNHPINKDFEPSPASGLDYIDNLSQGHDIRYDNTPNGPPLTIDGPSPTAPGLINHLFHPPVLNPTTSYSPDGSSYYQPQPQLFSNLDVRPRLGPTNPPATGMSQPPRYAALPHPAPQISTRDQYSTTTPTFRRPSEHPQRSPSSFPASLRRHPLSPTPSPITTFGHSVRMDSNQFKAQTQTVPPLNPLHSFGVLQYLDNSQGGPHPVKIDIHGNIDKGFFEADGEWTCYRRNYFSCICSYSLTPWITNQPMQFVQNNGTTYSILGFAMCISAVISDSDNQKIELVQHTPKRDKGPTEEPQKVRLQPKQQQAQNQLGLYPHDAGMGPASRLPYVADPYTGSQHGSDPTEVTFERIQFKQATANNGKRRAAQQYYHLVVELWGDVGGQGPDNNKFVKIAHRKSAKMIVRGRSPGHYQSERRGSTSSGPGGSAGTLGSYGGPMMGDFSSGGTMLGGGGYASSDYARTNPYGATRHQQDISLEPLIPNDDAKVIDTHKDYLYFPGAMSEGQHQTDGRGQVDMYTHHHRSGPDGMLPQLAGAIEGSERVNLKRDPECGMLPSLFQQTRCSPFTGKPGTEGYYPTVNMT